MKFNQLRLTGFKSFLEPTEILIKDGLTGIVGPNGCGKSNLVEALRWVMGEVSAKNMRGGAMDDVIFAGTISRPARNMAEVALSLDNKDKNAPANYNDFPEIDVTRRIRRDSGSDYKINGKSCRAKDIQLLFADMSTGAHSTAIVSQGRVGSLINAKPKDRRHLLEEAAGISGLHSRRRDAELRLQSAEANLERVDDTVEQLNSQLTSLKHQLRQAARYRNLSGHIRKTEALLLYFKQEQALKTEAIAKARLVDTNKAVETLTQQVLTAHISVDKASQIVPPLRKEEAAAAANRHQITANIDNLVREEAQLETTKNQFEDRKQQLSSDIKHEETLENDAHLVLRNLEGDKDKLLSRLSLAGPQIKNLAKAVKEHEQTLSFFQIALDKNSEALEAGKTQQNTLEVQRNNTIMMRDRLQDRLVQNNLKLKALIEEQRDPNLTRNLQKEISDISSELIELSLKITGTEETLISAKCLDVEARNHFRETEKKAASTAAKITTLESILKDNTRELWSPVLAHLTVIEGYEVALGAAFGEELEASLDESAPAYWRSERLLKERPLFKEGISTLDLFVTGEPALQARLSLIGVVAQNEGPHLADNLRVGQRLVSKQGDLWRWDGYVRKAGAKTPATLRLEQQNRLNGLKRDLHKDEEILQKARLHLQTTTDDLTAKSEKEKKLRETRRSKEQALTHLKSENEVLAHKQAASHFKRNALEEAQIALNDEISAMGSQLERTAQEIKSLPKLSHLIAQQHAQNEVVADQRHKTKTLKIEIDNLRRESSLHKSRLEEIEAEKHTWSQRLENMASHRIHLKERMASVLDELQILNKKPEELARKRLGLAEKSKASKTRQSVTKARLAEAEAVLKECNSAHLLSQTALSTCREMRVQHEADALHATEALDTLAEQILARLNCPPTGIRNAGGIEEEEEIPPFAMSQARLDRLKREREGMGPVNLRAQIETSEVQSRLDTLSHEKTDLEAAIHQLHQAVKHLNKEGRQRLLSAFSQVDSHFQKLFKQVFGGGHAHLTLTESDDPLAAGLEIMASPPGKNLQLMSLLSGGEQALTAIALLFSVFLTNPAPICVLDEVDAPLDDVNVQRLCNLLDMIAQNAQTRFLVVTHHPITMARMDRLFGVTMAERGISQLVSVDLGTARQMTEAAAET